MLAKKNSKNNSFFAFFIDDINYGGMFTLNKQVILFYCLPFSQYSPQKRVSLAFLVLDDLSLTVRCWEMPGSLP